METKHHSVRRGRAVRTGIGRPLKDAGRSSELPAFIAPQLATLVETVPVGQEWLHELKLDGYRIVCRIDHGDVRLLTRRAQDWTGSYGEVARATKKLNARQALLDGEVVVLDEHGKSDFQRLQNSLAGGGRSDLVYFVFDLLHLDGSDLTGAPLLERKELLRELLGSGTSRDAGTIRYCPHRAGDGQALYDQSCRQGLEGIISKRGDRPYKSERTRDWLKMKCIQRQEFVIGGFTEPAGARTGIGALLLGVYDEHGTLRYAGKVGTGFTQQTLGELRARLGPLGRDSAPFVDPPKGPAIKGVHWVEPHLVGEVAFTEWTADDLLRHPSFRGLREDKAPAAITREKPGTGARDPTREPAGVKGPRKLR